MKSWQVSAALVVVSALSGACGGGSTAASSPAAAGASGVDCAMSTVPPGVQTTGTRTLVPVVPSAASRCVTLDDAPSQALLDSSVPSKAVLAVFLPGTGGLPSQFPSFLQHGALRGYHVVGLAYVNPTSVNELCNTGRNAGNPDCAGDVREETFTGRDASALVAIGPSDSIEGRLAALLRYLRFHRASDGWGQYLNAQDGVDWSKVSIAGNSQGAGHAAYIAKSRAVRRVGLYAGPSDWVLATDQPARWYGRSSATPPEAYYGYLHVPDRVANASGRPDQVTAAWGAPDLLGMSGPVTDVTKNAPPFDGSHRLVTTACTGLGTIEEHNCPMFRGNEGVWSVVSFP